MEKEEIFRFFSAAEYDKCLRYGEKAVILDIPRDIKDFILLICSISSMFEGSSNIDKEIWLKEAHKWVFKVSGIEDNQRNPYG